MAENKTMQDENDQELNTANIMVAGKTGTGKSTLLNAIFGEDLATTGTGKPVTDHINEYQHDSIPIHIWDTVGLELDNEKTKQSIEEIKRTIASKADSKNSLDQIHAIWYCINSTSNRYEGAELDFIKELYSIGVPFTIVLTQCYGSKKTISEFEENINKINSEIGLNDIKIIKVLAQKFEIETDDDKVITKEAFGLDELVTLTMDQLPEYVQSGFIAAQRVSESMKHEECEKLIWNYVQHVKNNDWDNKNHIINWDNVPIINIMTTDSHINKLFRDISTIYNTEIPEGGIDKIMDELGGLNPENTWMGLINPFTEKFDNVVSKSYQKKAKGEFDVQFNNMDKNQRVARMIIMYGYTFLDAIEEFWEQYRDKKALELEDAINVLVGKIRDKCKNLNTRSRKMGEKNHE